jgi:hypothetical protein
MLRRLFLFSFPFVLTMTSILLPGQSCSEYNAQDTPFFWTPTNEVGHKVGGYHAFYSTLTGNCTYASIGGQYCSNTSYSYGSISGYDTGWPTYTNPLYGHYWGDAVKTGLSEAPVGGAATTSQVSAGGAVEACNLVTGCTVVVSINGGTSGVGATVSFPPSSIWSSGEADVQTVCPNELDPQYNGGSGFGGGGSCGSDGDCGPLQCCGPAGYCGPCQEQGYDDPELRQIQGMVRPNGKNPSGSTKTKSVKVGPN